MLLSACCLKDKNETIKFLTDVHHLEECIEIMSRQIISLKKNVFHLRLALHSQLSLSVKNVTTVPAQKQL